MFVCSRNQAATEVFGTSCEAPVTFGKPVFGCGGGLNPTSWENLQPNAGGEWNPLGPQVPLLKSKIHMDGCLFCWGRGRCGLRLPWEMEISEKILEGCDL